MFLKKTIFPADYFVEVMSIMRRCCKFSGVDLLDEHFKMDWRTKSLLLGVASYYVFVFSTIYTNYKDDWTIIIRVTVTLGTALQGTMKLLDYIARQEKISKLYQLLIELYKENQKLGQRHVNGLNEVAEKLKLNLFYLFVLYGFGYFGMLTVPYCSHILLGRRDLVIEFYVPGLDINTDFGYFTTLVFQSVLLVCFSFALYGGDAGTMMFITQAAMFSNIFEAKIDCINEIIENPENSKKPEVTNALKDIIEWHQLYSKYTREINGIFYNSITVQVLSAFSSTVLSIYLILVGGWPGAYTYVVVAFSSLYLYCIIGTKTEIANEQFELHLTKLKWYNLTVPQQKLVIQIIMKTQSPETIDIAGIMPLSVSTAMQLTKTIYTIAMFMRQFLVD